MKLTDTVSLAYILLLVSAVRPADGADCLSKSRTLDLRGLFALTVVLHHLSTRAYSGLIFPGFSYVGFISVSVFFFLSGYGLTVRFGQQGRPYLISVLVSRIPRMVAIYLMATAVYWLGFWAMGYDISLQYVLRSFINGSPLALNSWYITALILLYLVFCAVFACFGRRRGLSLCLLGAATLCYILTMHRLGYDYHWYMSTPGFWVGVFWAAYRQKLDGLINKHWLPAFGAVAVGFIAAYCLSGMTMLSPIPGMSLGSRLVACGLFPPLIVLIVTRLKLSSRILSFLGSISLELYLFHGLVYTFLRSSDVYIQSNALWVWASVLLSIALAYAMNRLFAAITGSVRAIGRSH